MPVTEFWAWEDEEEYRKKRAEERAREMRAAQPAPVRPPVTPTPQPVQPAPPTAPGWFSEFRQAVWPQETTKALLGLARIAQETAQGKRDYGDVLAQWKATSREAAETTPAGWMGGELYQRSPVPLPVGPGAVGLWRMGQQAATEPMTVTPKQDWVRDLADQRAAASQRSPILRTAVQAFGFGSAPQDWRPVGQTEVVENPIGQGMDTLEAAAGASREYVAQPLTGFFGVMYDMATGRYTPEQVEEMGHQLSNFSPDDPYWKQAWESLRGAYKVSQGRFETLPPAVQFLGAFGLDPLGPLGNAAMGSMLPTEGPLALITSLYKGIDAIDYASNLMTMSPEGLPGMVLQGLAVRGLFKGVAELNLFVRAKKLVNADPDVLTVRAFEQGGARDAALRMTEQGTPATAEQVLAVARGNPLPNTPPEVVGQVQTAYRDLRGLVEAQRQAARAYKPFQGITPNADRFHFLTLEAEKTAIALKNPATPNKPQLAERWGELMGQMMFHAQALTERVAGGARTMLAEQTGALTVGADRPLSEWSDADLSDEAARLGDLLKDPGMQDSPKFMDWFTRQGEIADEMERRAAQPPAQEAVEPTQNALDRLLAVNREIGDLERQYNTNAAIRERTSAVRAESDRLRDRLNALEAEKRALQPEADRIAQEQIDREKAAREQRDMQEQQRRAQAVNRLDPSETSPYALAADYKARGMDRTRAWDQFVIDRNLKPEINAAEFYRAYDSVEAKPLPTTRGEREGYAPTPQPSPQPAPTRPAPEEPSFVRRPPGIQTHPDLAEATRWAEEHRYTSGKTIKSRVDELLAAGGVVTDKGASITIKPPTGKGQTFTDVVALNYIRAVQQAKPPAKQAWEMTPLEWARQELNNPNIVAAGSYGAQHRVEVRGALERGDPVPANVLALYPDLAEQFARPAQPAAPEPALRPQAEPLLRPQAATAPKPAAAQSGLPMGEAGRATLDRAGLTRPVAEAAPEVLTTPEFASASDQANYEAMRGEAAGQQRLGETEPPGDEQTVARFEALQREFEELRRVPEPQRTAEQSARLKQIDEEWTSLQDEAGRASVRLRDARAAKTVAEQSVAKVIEALEWADSSGRLSGAEDLTLRNMSPQELVDLARRTVERIGYGAAWAYGDAYPAARKLLAEIPPAPANARTDDSVWQRAIELARKQPPPVVAPRITTEPDRGPFMTERQAAPEDVARMRAEDERARQEAAGQQRLGETPAEPAPAEPVEPAAPRYTDTPEGQEYQRRFDRSMQVIEEAYAEAGAKWEGGTAEDDEAALAYWRRKSGAVNELAMLMDGEDRDLLRQSVSRKRLGGGEATRESVFGEERMVSRGPASAADIERANSEAVRRLEEHYSETAKGFLLTMGYTEADLSGVTQWSQWRKLLQEIEQGRLAKRGSGGVAKIDDVKPERRKRALAYRNTLPPGVAYHLAKYAGDVRLAKADVKSAILERHLSDVPLDKQLITDFEEALLRLPDDYADTPRLAEEAAGRQYQGGTDMAPRYIEVERVPLPLGDAIVRAQAKAQAGQPARVTTSEGDSEIGRLVRFIHAAADRAAVPRDAAGNVVLETDLGRVILGQERAKGLPKYSVQVEKPDPDVARWDAEQARDDAEAARREQEHLEWQAEQARLDAEIEASWEEKPTTEVPGLAERQAAYERAHERRMQPAEPLENVDPERVVEVLTRPAETEALTPEETEAVRQGAAEGKPIEQVVDEALHPRAEEAAPEAEPAQPAPGAAGGDAGGRGPRQPSLMPGEPEPEPQGQPVQPQMPGPGGMGPGDTLENLRASRQPETPAEKSFREKVSGWITKARVAWLNRYHRFWQLQKASGVQVEWSAERIEAGIRHGESLIEQKLIPVMRPVQAHWEDWKDYLELRRMEDLLARNPNAELPAGIQHPTKLLNQLQTKLGPETWQLFQDTYAPFRQTVKELTLDEGVKGDLLNDTQAQDMLARHPNYVPFLRQGFDLNEWAQPGTRKAADAPDVFYKRMNEEGSLRKLKDPLDALYHNIVAQQVLIKRNETARLFHEAMIKAHPDMVGAVRRVMVPGGTARGGEQILLDRGWEAENEGWEVISYRKKGEVVRFAVPPEWAAAAKGMEAYTLGAFERIARAVSQPMVEGAVRYNIEYPIANLFRDAPTAWMREGLVPFGKTWWRGMLAAFTHNDDYHRAAQADALSGTLTEQYDMKALLDKGRSRTGMGIRIRNWRDAAKLLANLSPTLSENIELGTRVGSFLLLEKQNVKGLELSHRTLNATGNWGRAGNAMRVVNAVARFLNVPVQAGDLMIRSFKENPAQFAKRLVPIITGAALLHLWNQRFSTYNLLPDYEKVANFIVMLDDGEEEQDPRYPLSQPKPYPIALTIPKMESLIPLLTMLDIVLDQAWKDNDQTAGEVFLDGLVQSLGAATPLGSGVSRLLPPVSGTIVQLAMNKDVFRGEDIVPQSEINMPPYAQYGEDTYTSAVKIGELLGVSPRKVQFAVEDMLAGGGDQMMWFLGFLADSVGIRPVTPGQAKDQPKTKLEQLNEIPLIRRFITTRNTGPVRQTLKQLDRLQRQQNDELYRAIPEARRLGKTFGMPGSTYTVEGIPIEVRPEERLRILQESKDIRLQVLSDLVASPEFQAMNDIERSKAWDKEVARVNEIVREYVMSASPYVADARAKAKMVPAGVRAQYEAYSDIAEYRAVVLDPSGKGIRVVDLDAQQATRIQEAQSVISDIRGLYSDMYGKTLSKKKAAYLYYQLTGDLEGAMLALTTRVRANPERELYWDSHPLLADYYPRKAVAEETPDATSPMQAYSNWMNLPVARTSEAVAAG